jgi:hypothetical protein
MRNLMALLVLLAMAHSTKVEIRVEDASGEALKDELVIVQDLNNREHEVLRVLTDKSGNIPPFELSPGLYRAIATAPYGLWQSEVHEFLVGEKSVALVIRVQMLPTHGYGDIVTVGTNFIRLRVLKTDGQPASGANVFVRDRDATLYLERCYRTNAEGEAKIELVSDPTVLVIVFRDSLTTKEVGNKSGDLIVRLAKN